MGDRAPRAPPGGKSSSKKTGFIVSRGSPDGVQAVALPVQSSQALSSLKVSQSHFSRT
jgi:hypothetical protein